MDFSPVLDALYPSACIVCRSRGAALCDACLPARSERVRFSRAGLEIVASGSYAGTFRRAILAFKRGRRDATRPLAALLARSLASASVLRDTLVVPVPTTHRRALDRGFDQSVALARELAVRDARPVLVALRKRFRDP